MRDKTFRLTSISSLFTIQTGDYSITDHRKGSRLKYLIQNQRAFLCFIIAGGQTKKLEIGLFFFGGRGPLTNFPPGAIGPPEVTSTFRGTKSETILLLLLYADAVLIMEEIYVDSGMDALRWWDDIAT